MPALRGSKTVNDALKAGSKSIATIAGERFRSALVVGEIALALVLLVGAGLMLKSFVRLLAVNPGFDADRVLTARIWLPSSRYVDSSSKLKFFNQLLARTKALPGVQSASLTSALPMTGVTFGAPFSMGLR